MAFPAAVHAPGRSSQAWQTAQTHVEALRGRGWYGRGALFVGRRGRRGHKWAFLRAWRVSLVGTYVLATRLQPSLAIGWAPARLSSEAERTSLNPSVMPTGTKTVKQKAHGAFIHMILIQSVIMPQLCMVVVISMSIARITWPSALRDLSMEPIPDAYGFWLRGNKSFFTPGVLQRTDLNASSPTYLRWLPPPGAPTFIHEA